MTMDIKLMKATHDDAASIYDSQVQAFRPILNKYKDYVTSPANEGIERVSTRISRTNGGNILIDGGYQSKSHSPQTMDEEVAYYEKDFEEYVDTWDEF